MEAINRALWIYGDYGINFRTGSVFRSPLNRIENQVLRVPVERANRILSVSTFVLLYSGRQKESQDRELTQIVSEGGRISRTELARELGISIRKLNYRLRKEMKRWNIFKKDEYIYDSLTYVNDHGGPSTPEKIIMTILTLYPFLTVRQLEYLTGFDQYQLSQILSKLVLKKRINRGITRTGAPDEIFAVYDQPVLEEIEIEPFVLEKRDALVDIIKLERYFKHKDADYWIFIDGIPQAEFDLNRKKRSQTYVVTNLSRFSTTEMELQQLLETIEKWGIRYKLNLEISSIKDPITKYSIDLTTSLTQRGYKLKDDTLVLDRRIKAKYGKQDNRKHTNEREILKQNDKIKGELNWKLLGPWCRAKQLIGYDGTAHEILYELGQLDEIISIAYRLNIAPDKIGFSNVIFIPGINHRLGYVAVELVEDILGGWPRDGSYTFLDKKILGVLSEPMSTREIVAETGSDAHTVKQRLRYLEQLRRIRKLIPGSLNVSSCLWVKFEYGLPDFSRPVGSKRKIASVGVFLKKLLASHPPLTISQLSKYLGLTNKELKSILRYFIERDEIIEGYFLSELPSIQYTLPSLLNKFSLETLEEYPSNQRVDIFPMSDPYSFLHLPFVVASNPSIQLTDRLDSSATQWMVTWDGRPVGYLVLSPSNKALVDYEVSVLLIEKMITIPVLSGTFQTLAMIMQSWYRNNGLIKEINNTPITEKKWEGLHFIIESLGFTI